jgi:hypothetical protein
VSLALRIVASTEIARAICLGDFFRAPEPEKARILWNSGIHDAGVQFFTTDAQLDPTTAEKTARQNAGAETRSFAFGSCPAGKSEARSPSTWIAFFLAPAPVKLHDDRMEIPGGDSCASLIVRSVTARGPSQIIDRRPDGSWQFPRQDGVVTVTCSHDSAQIQRAAYKGPELWYAIPTGKGPASRVPAEKSLITWINQVRKLENLEPLKSVKLRRAPDLSRDETPLHDRKKLREIAVLARNQQKLSLVGEDRVIARSTEDAAWLLWNSPRHRDLLLSKDARSIMVQETINKPDDKRQGTITSSLLLFSPCAACKR